VAQRAGLQRREHVVGAADLQPAGPGHAVGQQADAKQARVVDQIRLAQQPARLAGARLGKRLPGVVDHDDRRRRDQLAQLRDDVGEPPAAQDDVQERAVKWHDA
jgi:hypothetical protein